MKNNTRAIITCAMLQLTAVSPLLVYGNIALADHHEGMMSMETKADHEKVAGMYENEVKMLQQKIAQHEQMEKSYQAMGSKQGGAPLVNHCKSIVASYKAAIEENTALAKHHHDMAAAAEK